MITEAPPIAVCTKCGDITYQAERINQQCGRQPGGKRCGGVYGSALNNDDWAKCGVCAGTGKSDTGRSCEACQGTSWRFVRNRARRLSN